LSYTVSKLVRFLRHSVHADRPPLCAVDLDYGSL